MGVGLYLVGECPALANQGHEAWFSNVESWFVDSAGDAFEHCQIGREHDDRPALLVQLHPSGEPLRIVDNGDGSFVAEAKTSTVGPGYHTYVAELLHRFQNAHDIHWQTTQADEDTGDETGYFFTRDRAAVESEMLSWLKSIGGIVTENFQAGYEMTMVSMPLDSFTCPQQSATMTPMGFRDASWFAGAQQSPESHKDIFPWWEDGTGADFHLGRALHQMWTDIRWRCPFSEQEFDVQRRVLRDLHQAYQFDANRHFPWREWDELLECFIMSGECEDEDLPPTDLQRLIAARAAEIPDGSLIGFRRELLQLPVNAGWRIRLPGDMAEEWNDGTWSAWNGTRTVWITTFSAQAEDGNERPARYMLNALMRDDTDGEPHEFADDQLVAMAFWLPYEEEGKSLWNLKCFSAVPNNGAICNIYVEGPNDREWALSAWQSLTHEKKSSG